MEATGSPVVLLDFSSADLNVFLQHQQLVHHSYSCPLLVVVATSVVWPLDVFKQQGGESIFEPFFEGKAVGSAHGF